MTAWIRRSLAELTVGLVGVVFIASSATAMGIADFLGLTKVPFIVPAKYPGAATLRSLTVVPYDQRAAQLTTVLETDLVGLRVEDRPYYGRVEVLPPPASGANDLFTLTSAISKKTAGAVSVKFTQMEVAKATSQQDRSSCGASSGKVISTCPKNATRTSKVNCNTRTAELTVLIRVFNVAEHRLIASDLIPAQESATLCQGDQGAMPSDDELYSGAAQVLRKAILTSLAPSVEERRLELLDPDAKVTGADRDTFVGAVKFAKAKRMDEACSRFDKLYESNKDSVSLTYNYGFCQESLGELPKAAEAYHQSSTLANTPVSVIDKHLLDVDHKLKAGNGTVADESLSAQIPILQPGVKPTLEKIKRERRVALVIGNAKYELHPLAKSATDANLIAQALRDAGFDVTPAINKTSGELREYVDNFVEKSRNADAALLYYSGHGFQSDGENWLMPVDDSHINCLGEAISGREGSDLPWAIQLNTIVDKLDDVNAAAKILVFDACRDSRFPSCNKGGPIRGLAASRTPGLGSIIIYTTSPGMTVPDNGIFAEQFAKAIRTADVKLQDVLTQLNDSVSKKAKTLGYTQTPVELGSMTGDFYFKVSR